MRQFGFRPIQENSVAVMEQGSRLDHEESRLVEAACVDPAAFDILYQRYLTPVYRYLCLHSASDEDAADLTQQVFLQALQALPRYEARQLPFAAWLFRIARNLAVDNYRRRRPTLAWEGLPKLFSRLAKATLKRLYLRTKSSLNCACFLIGSARTSANCWLYALGPGLPPVRLRWSSANARKRYKNNW